MKVSERELQYTAVVVRFLSPDLRSDLVSLILC